MWPPPNRVGAEFIGATRKERPCFAAERGLDRLGHTSLRMVYWRHTKGTALFCYWSHTKRSALFCCRTWPRPPWAHKPPDGLLAAHERNGAVLLQNAAPTPLSTHEHSRVHFSILTPPGRDLSPSVYWSHNEKNGPVLLQNVASTALGTQASGWFIGGTRKERRCFAAECGPDPFGHTRALEGPFFDPNPRARTAARQSSSGSGNRGRILPRQILFVKCAFYSGPVADLGGDPFPRCGLH